MAGKHSLTELLSFVVTKDTYVHRTCQHVDATVKGGMGP
jgi:hypothetical protein